MKPRLRLAVGLAAVAGVGALTWLSFARHPTGSEIEVCRFVTARELDDAAALWRARARGEAAPENDPKSSRAAACAPLYREPACREAWMTMATRTRETAGATSGPAAGRVDIGDVVTACRDAYCPKLTNGRPTLCERDPKGLPPSEWMPLWRELDDAILAYDLGRRADPVLDARRRGAEALESALREYANAGSPSWRSGALDVRMTGPGRIEVSPRRPDGSP